LLKGEKNKRQEMMSGTTSGLNTGKNSKQKMEMKDKKRSWEKVALGSGGLGTVRKIGDVGLNWP